VPRSIAVGEATAARRRAYFQLVGADFTTPALSEAGGQPQISTDGAAWTDTGIGVLVSVGNGRYYATLTTGSVAAVAAIETRYKSASTAECPGDSIEVIIPVATAVWTDTLVSYTDGMAGYLVQDGLKKADAYCRPTGSTTTNFVLAANAPSESLADHHIVITNGPLAGYSGIITAYNTTTKEATVFPAAAAAPGSTDGYVLRGYSASRLTPTGLDTVMVEAGVNVRQALSPILAASAGVLLGAGSGSITIRGGNSAVTRITATTDNAGNRTAVTLALPT
jgi:hypothetical protein